MIDSTRKINTELTLKGVIIAGKNIGRKYLKPELDKNIQSEKYKIIFEKISEIVINDGTDKFIKKDIFEVLSWEEKSSFNGFLSKAKKLGIIRQENYHKPGEYVFSNKLYPIYFLIQKNTHDFSN